MDPAEDDEWDEYGQLVEVIVFIWLGWCLRWW